MPLILTGTARVYIGRAVTEIMQAQEQGALCDAGLLPPQFEYTEELELAFVAAALRVAAEWCERPYRLNSTMEELAGHALIDRARKLADEDTAPQVCGELYDWDEDAFEDHDVQMLFEPQFDGVERSAEMTEALMTENLAPEDWEKPFRPRD